jgi:PiT family inorganic phosphate transporter
VEIALVLALGLGLYMAFAIGANDVANAMGTSVGSRALTIRQAIVIAAILEFAGAVLVGGHVTNTIRGGILDASVSAEFPRLVIYGMLASLTSAGTWLLVASRLGWPVSTTHSIVGAIAGFGLVAFGAEAVQWGKFSSIVASWVVSPLLAGVVAFSIFSVIQHNILDREDPIAQLKRWGPAYVFAVVVVIGMVTLFKGLANLKLDFSFGAALGLSIAIGAAAAAIAAVRFQRVHVDPNLDRDFHYANVERIFGSLQILSACSVAFAHGANDVANSIGPLAAVVDIVRTGALHASAPVPLELLLLGGVGIVLGLALMGYQVMLTIGEKITELTPTRGYAAEFAAATTIVIASRMGLPISTTHTLVGAVLGVGLARGIGALDYRVVGTIVVSWVVTIPVGAALSIFFYYFYKGLLD